MVKKLDVDIDQGIYGTPGGVLATVIPVNKKCSGCLHYLLNRTACTIGKQPRSCGGGSSPETGYAPLISDSESYQECRKKMGLKNQAPSAQAGKANKIEGPSFSVHVLGDGNKGSLAHKSLEVEEHWLYKAFMNVSKALPGQYGQESSMEWTNPTFRSRHEKPALGPSIAAGGRSSGYGQIGGAGPSIQTAGAVDNSPSGMQLAKPHPMDKQNWTHGARSSAVTTPEGHRFTIIKNTDNSFHLHVRGADGKAHYHHDSGPSATPAGAQKFSSMHEAAGAAVRAYGKMPKAGMAATGTRKSLLRIDVIYSDDSISKSVPLNMKHDGARFGRAVPNRAGYGSGVMDFEKMEAHWVHPGGRAERISHPSGKFSDKQEMIKAVTTHYHTKVAPMYDKKSLVFDMAKSALDLMAQVEETISKAMAAGAAPEPVVTPHGNYHIVPHESGKGYAVHFVPKTAGKVPGKSEQVAGHTGGVSAEGAKTLIAAHSNLHTMKQAISSTQGKKVGLEQRGPTGIHQNVKLARSVSDEDLIKSANMLARAIRLYKSEHVCTCSH